MDSMVPASLIFQEATCFPPVRCTIPILISTSSCWTTLGTGQSSKCSCSKTTLTPTHGVCAWHLMDVLISTFYVSFADVLLSPCKCALFMCFCGRLMSALCLGDSFLAFCFWNNVFLRPTSFI